MQAKKNKRRFTIQFNEIEPSHLLAIEVLNDLPSRSVARYIALAIEYYESNIKKVTKKSNTDNSVKRKRGRPPKVQSKPEETQSTLTEQSTALEKTEEIPQRHSHIQNNQEVKKTNDTADNVEQVDGLEMELIDDEDKSPKVDPTMLESMMGYINS